MKNLMIAVIMLAACSLGCEQVAVLTGGTSPENSQAQETNRVYFLYDCSEDCNEGEKCTQAEKIACGFVSKIYVSQAIYFSGKRPKGTVCVPGPIFSSCITKEEFLFDYSVIVNSSNPELVAGKIIDAKGNVFAETYVSEFYKESGEVSLKFEVINNNFINEFLTLEIDIAIDNNYEEKITIVAELGQ